MTKYSKWIGRKAFGDVKQGKSCLFSSSEQSLAHDCIIRSEDFMLLCYLFLHSWSFLLKRIVQRAFFSQFSTHPYDLEQRSMFRRPLRDS